MSQKLNGYSMMDSIFSTGFDIYDPSGCPAYYRSRHSFPTKKEAINAILCIIQEKKNN
jgi:hypothetical protein|tara:strand:+ start:976 stop:1149 length:174 start_codon:yes stop_codon:yes gene_type:complete